MKGACHLPRRPRGAWDGAEPEYAGEERGGVNRGAGRRRLVESVKDVGCLLLQRRGEPVRATGRGGAAAGSALHLALGPIERAEHTLPAAQQLLGQGQHWQRPGMAGGLGPAWGVRQASGLRTTGGRAGRRDGCMGEQRRTRVPMATLRRRCLPRDSAGRSATGSSVGGGASVSAGHAAGWPDGPQCPRHEPQRVQALPLRQTTSGPAGGSAHAMGRNLARSRGHPPVKAQSFF